MVGKIVSLYVLPISLQILLLHTGVRPWRAAQIRAEALCMSGILPHATPPLTSTPCEINSEIACACACTHALHTYQLSVSLRVRGCEFAQSPAVDLCKGLFLDKLIYGVYTHQGAYRDITAPRRQHHGIGLKVVTCLHLRTKSTCARRVRDTCS